VHEDAQLVRAIAGENVYLSVADGEAECAASRERSLCFEVDRGDVVSFSTARHKAAAMRLRDGAIVALGVKQARGPVKYRRPSTGDAEK
jgi:hypothetical protein